MEVRKLVVTRTLKVRLGDYESQDVGVSMEADLDTFDDVAECVSELASKTRDALMDQVARLHRGRLTPGQTLDLAKLRSRHGLDG